ncbi:MAG: IS110 family transposase, partial [Planctomycetaceae bacterium]|nr:IS110 family transposase [Planctomycetaceae bacterium]
MCGPSPHEFRRAVQPFREDLIVGVECMFTWYWLADLCLDENIKFILGHALYMKAIHGGKKKDDKIDSEKIARLMRGGTFPLSYVYPREMRATRDLLRRRTFLMRRRSELLAHVQLVNQQYNHDPFEKMLQYACNRDVLDRFELVGARQSVEADLQMIGHYDQLLKQLESSLVRQGFVFNAQALREGLGRASLNALTRRICRTGEAANVVVSKQETKGPKYASAHDLRRSFGFRWAGKCRRPSALQALMRHSSI